jgi:RND family efflux transporter MFP subunit
MSSPANSPSPLQPSGLASASRRIGLILGLLLVLGALFAIGFWPRWHAMQTAQAEATAESAPTVVYVVAERGKAKSDLALPANLKALQETIIYARTSGYLKRWLVDIGDHVKAGQLLAEIEAPEVDRELQEVQAKLAQVNAHLQLAHSTAERYRALAKEEGVSPQELEEKVGAYEARKADQAAVRAQLQRLEQMRSYQRVVAPFSGTITARNVEVGTLIQAGSSSSSGWLFKLSQTDTMRVHVAVPQNYLKLVKPGMEAALSVPELGDKSFSGKVSRSAGAFDPSTRTMVVELMVPNPDGSLIPGMYAQAKFHIENPQPFLMVPVTAVMIGGEGVRVATLDANDTVHIKKVRVGRDFGKEVEVVDGLQDKERVVNNPRDNLEDGAHVKPVLQAKHDKKDEKKEDKKDPAKPAAQAGAKS